MNNNRIFGYNRDKLIIEIIEKFKCLDAEQIQILFFNNTCNLTSAKIQTQHRLKILSEKKKSIKRWRMDLDEPYKYFIDDFAQKEHICLLNWILINYLINNKFEKIYHIEYQRNYKIKIPDLFLVTYNQFNKEKPYKAIFFEMDKTITNKFDTIEKYNNLFESKPVDEYVQLTTPHFPKIIIATTEKNRLFEIIKLSQDKNINRNKLYFDVNLIWKIKERCKNEKIENFSSKFINIHNQLQISLC